MPARRLTIIADHLNGLRDRFRDAAASGRHEETRIPFQLDQSTGQVRHTVLKPQSLNLNR